MDHENILKDVQCGVSLEVVKIDGGTEFRSRLHSLGLYEGKIIQKICSVKLGGPVLVEVDRAQIAIGKRMASKIFVKLVK